MRKRTLIQKITRVIFGSPYERRVHGSTHFWNLIAGGMYVAIPLGVVLLIGGAQLLGLGRLVHIWLIESSGIFWPLVYVSYIVYGACAVLWVKKRRR